MCYLKSINKNSPFNENGMISEPVNVTLKENELNDGRAYIQATDVQVECVAKNAYIDNMKPEKTKLKSLNLRREKELEEFALSLRALGNVKERFVN